MRQGMYSFELLLPTNGVPYWQDSRMHTMKIRLIHREYRQHQALPSFRNIGKVFSNNGKLLGFPNHVAGSCEFTMPTHPQ